VSALALVEDYAAVNDWAVPARTADTARCTTLRPGLVVMRVMRAVRPEPTELAELMEAVAAIEQAIALPGLGMAPQIDFILGRLVANGVGANGFVERNLEVQVAGPQTV
jgi:hypothetical protein